MDLESFFFLQSPAAKALLSKGKGMDPARFALQLQGQDVPVAELATQLKYRERAALKLPAWVEADCLFEPKAFEQATSEQLALLKPWGKGETALDLTCGLGVDSWALSQHFDEVTSLEPDRLRYILARHNFAQLQADNIHLMHSDAESWLDAFAEKTFDLFYIDPDRRDIAGGKLFRLRDCAPDILSLLDGLFARAPRILLKSSPMLDITAALKDLRRVHRVSVLSVDGECKELLFELRTELANDAKAQFAVQFIRRGKAHAWEGTPSDVEFSPKELEAPSFLYEADISLYKARMAAEWFGDQYFGKGEMSHPEGYFFSQVAIGDFPSRVFSVVEAMPWKPDQVKKYFKQKAISQVNLTRRHFDLPLEQVRQQLKIAEGGTDYLLLTQVWRNGAWERVAFHAKRADA